MTDKEQLIHVCRIAYLSLVLISVIYMTIVLFFCTSKEVYVSGTTNLYYRRMSTKDGRTFWRPVKKFIFKNIFTYIVADDELTVPDLIPYKEWSRLNGIKIASNPNDIVFDPFMGVGSTGVAAKICERKFIGCEIDPIYYEAACKRLGVTP